MKKTKFNFLSFAVLIMLMITSCHEETTDQELTRFDLSTYTALKTNVSELKPLDIKTLESAFNNALTSERNEDNIKQLVVDEVNESLDETVLQIEAVEYIEYEGEEILQKGLDDDIFTALDVEIANEVAADIYDFGVDTAIQNMESKLLDLQVDQPVFEHYNQFANQLLLNVDGIESSGTTTIEFDNVRSTGGLRCALAIVAYTLSTVAVGAACTPNPTTPISCPLAITQSSIAYTAMILACKKKETPEITDN